MKYGELVFYIQGGSPGHLSSDGSYDLERGIREEDESAEQNIAALQESGHTVVRIGNARDGFALAQLYTEIQRFPYASTFILDAHAAAQEGPEGE